MSLITLIDLLSEWFVVPLDSGRFRRQSALILVGLAALAIAAVHYWDFWQHARSLWQGMAHDRNAHYEFAQKMAFAIRQGDLRTFFATLEKSKVWPPLHGLAAVIPLMIGGLDYRLAVLPSLTGWIMTVVFSFLVARRISAGFGDLAGVVAAVFVLVSPAYRLYGTDIMLESLGAGLTMLALYLHTVARQTGSLPAWRGFALTLTLLFFEKYNYWLLLVLALGAAEIAGWRGEDWLAAIDRLRRVDLKRWLRRQFRQPLNYLIVGLFLLVCSIFVLQPPPLVLGGQRVSVYPPENFITLIYALLFVRTVMAWIQCPQPVIRSRPIARILLLWHGLPVAISFLIPHRLTAFAWFVGPSNHDQQVKSFAEGIVFCVTTVWTDYHGATWSAAVAGILFGLSLLSFPRMRNEARAVIALVVISGLLTAVHPNKKGRFVHSWLAAGWAAGGAALATTFSRLPRLRPEISFVFGIALTLCHIPLFAHTFPAAGSGRGPGPTSLLDLSDAYLPVLAGINRIAVFSTVPCDQFVRWSYRDRYNREPPITFPLKDFSMSAEAVRQNTENWIQTADPDAVLVIDALPGSTDFFECHAYAGYAEIRASLDRSRRFRPAEEWNFPKHGYVIRLWRRTNS